MLRNICSQRGSRLLVLADQGLLSGFAFLTTLVLLRGMGLTGFGVYSLLALGWLWALGLVQAVLIQPMQTLVGQRMGARRKSFLSACWWMAVGTGVLTAGLSGAVLLGLDYDLQSSMAFASFLLARTLQLQLRTAAFVVGNRRSALISDGVGQVGGFLALIALAPGWEWSLASVLWLQAGSWGLAGLYSWTVFEGRGARPLPLGSMAQRHWHFSKWLAGMAAVRWVSSNAFLLALAAQYGPASLAVMRGVQAVVGVANLGLAAMESVLPTGAALRAGQGGACEMFRYLRGFAISAAAPLVLLVTGICVAADPLLALVFGGTPPESAKSALLGLVFLPVTSFLYTLYSVAYRTLHRTHHMFMAYGLVALLVAAVAPSVVAHFGMGGAALGMALQPLVMAGLLAVGLFPGRVGRQPA